MMTDEEFSKALTLELDRRFDALVKVRAEMAKSNLLPITIEILDTLITQISFFRAFSAPSTSSEDLREEFEEGLRCWREGV